jgi:hypothetical protein
VCVGGCGVNYFYGPKPIHFQPVNNVQPYVLSTIYEWVIHWLMVDPNSKKFVTLNVKSSAGQHKHNKVDMVIRRVGVTRSLVLCVCFVDRCLSFCTFCFGYWFSILFRFTDSYYPFGIFKLFLRPYYINMYLICDL